MNTEVPHVSACNHLLHRHFYNKVMGYTNFLLVTILFLGFAFQICSDGLTNCSSCSIITSTTPGTLPSPFPSASTPIHTMRHNGSDDSQHSRPRRHSASLTPQDKFVGPQHDIDDDSEALDRISDILSHLIKEASDAVNGIDRERTKTTTPKLSNSSKHSMASQVKTTEPNKETSSDLTHKSKFQTHPQASDHLHPSNRRRSIKSMPPPSRQELNTDSKEDKLSSNAIKRRSSGSIGKSRWSRSSANKEAMQTNLVAQRTGTSATTTKVLSTRSSHSLPNSPRIMRSPRRNRILNEPLLESYKRIDDSLAMVDSLSRDLAADIDPTEEGSGSVDARIPSAYSKHTTVARNDANESLSLVILLLVQGIHSVLAFLSGMISLKSSGLHLETLESDTFYNALSWAFTYTMGNVLVDQCIEKAPAHPPRRVSIPGGYYSRSPSPPPLTLVPSSLLAKNKQRAIASHSHEVTNHNDHRDIMPCVSQSSSILEKKSASKSIHSRRNWRNSENVIEKLIVHSPTKRFHHPILGTANADHNDEEEEEEEEVLQVLAVKRVRKTTLVRGNGVRILERRNST